MSENYFYTTTTIYFGLVFYACLIANTNNIIILIYIYILYIVKFIYIGKRIMH